MSGKEKNNEKSLEDLLAEDGLDIEEDNKYYSKEDEYVYGDSDDLGDWGDDPYANPVQGEVKKGRYSHLLEDEDENEDEQEPDITFKERVENITNRVLDFIESRKFTTIQWVVALGILIVIGIVIVLLLQAGSNLDSNVAIQEEGRAQYVAREIAPEEFDYQKQHDDELRRQQQELEEYIERNSRTYEEQVNDLGDIPDDYVLVQDVNGDVSYISPEEYEELLNPEVRDNTIADLEESDGADYIRDIELEIMPASEDTWHRNIYGAMDGSVNDVDLYQTRGQYIYFAQKALTYLFANQILDSDFNTETYTLEIVLNKDATFQLPDDFEDRMHYTYRNSGYQEIAPDALTIEYQEMGVDEFLSEN